MVLVDDKIRSVVTEEMTVVFEIKALYKDAEETEITSDTFAANLKFEPVEKEDEVEELVEAAAEAEEKVPEENGENEEEEKPVEAVAPPAEVKQKVETVKS